MARSPSTGWPDPKLRSGGDAWYLQIMRRLLLSALLAFLGTTLGLPRAQAQDDAREDPEAAYQIAGEAEAGGQAEVEAGGEAEAGADTTAGGEVVDLEGEGTGLPLPYAQRPLTLTEGTIRGDADFVIARVLTTRGTMATGFRVVSDTAAALVVGGGYGILDDLEVGATVLPLQLAPDFEYGDPSIYGVFRFLRGSVDLGASLSLTFPVQGDFVMAPGVPVLFHLGESMRLDTGLFVPIVFDSPDTYAVLSIPVRFSVNVIPELFLGASTGLEMVEFDPDFTTIPLGFHAGYTIAQGDTGGPLLDLMAGFRFPAFLVPASDGDVVVTRRWVLTFGARLYIDT